MVKSFDHQVVDSVAGNPGGLLSNVQNTKKSEEKMNKRFMALTAMVAILLLSFAGNVFASDGEPAPYSFTVNGTAPAFLGVSAEGYVGVYANNTDVAVEDVEFIMSVDGPAFTLAAYTMETDGTISELLNTVQSQAVEELVGFSQQRTFDVPAHIWVGVRFNVGGSSASSDEEACIESGSYTTSASLQLRETLDPDSAVITTIPFGTPIVVEDAGCGRVMVTYAGNTGSVDVRWLVVDNGSNDGTGGNGGGGGNNFVCTNPFEWPSAFVTELGLGGAATQAGTYGIVQWYRPSVTNTSAANHAGAFLVHGSIDLASDVSGAVWWLPGASQAQAQCLLNQDNVAVQFGTDAP